MFTQEFRNALLLAFTTVMMYNSDDYDNAIRFDEKLEENAGRVLTQLTRIMETPKAKLPSSIVIDSNDKQFRIALALRFGNEKPQSEETKRLISFLSPLMSQTYRKSRRGRSQLSDIQKVQEFVAYGDFVSDLNVSFE